MKPRFLQAVSPCLVICLLVAATATVPASTGDAGPAGAPGPSVGPCSFEVDILFVFDTTSSMIAYINRAKAEAVNLMNSVQATIPNARFAVADFRDYFGFYSYPGYSAQYGSVQDYPWMLRSPMSPSIAAANAAIQALGWSGGAHDWPEAVTRPLYEARTDPAIGWSPQALQIMVLITDAQPHDLDFAGNNNGGDPGPDAIAGNADDLDFETEAAALGAAGIRVAAIHANPNFVINAQPYMEHIAKATNGAYARLPNTEFANVIGPLIEHLSQNAAADAGILSVQVDQALDPPVPPRDIESSLWQDIAPNDSYKVVHALPVAIGPLFIDAQTVTTSVQADPTFPDASALARVEGLRVMLGTTPVLEADILQTSTSAWAGLGASGAPTADAQDTGSYIAGLVVAGNPVSASAPPNTVIPIPGVGQVVVHEEVGSVTGVSADKGITLLAVHLEVDGHAIDLRFVHAWSGAACGPAPWGPPSEIRTLLPDDPEGFVQDLLARLP